MKTYNVIKNKLASPKFNKGDKVITTLTGKEILTVTDGTFHNGFMYMYYFEEDDMGCGQMYITLAKDTKPSYEELKIINDSLLSALKDAVMTLDFMKEAGAAFYSGDTDRLNNAKEAIKQAEEL